MCEFVSLHWETAIISSCEKGKKISLRNVCTRLSNGSLPHRKSRSDFNNHCWL